jgi:ABC-type oligopeptide transport system substrate-binding subunit
VTYKTHNGGTDELFSALAQMWRRELGYVVGTATILDASRPSAEQPHISTIGICAEVPDPSYFLDSFLHTRGNQNWIGFSEPILDGYLDRARGARSPAERIALFQQAEAYLLDNALIVPLRHTSSAMLIKPHLRGFLNHPMTVPQADRVSIVAPPQ